MSLNYRTAVVLFRYRGVKLPEFIVCPPQFAIFFSCGLRRMRSIGRFEDNAAEACAQRPPSNIQVIHQSGVLHDRFVALAGVFAEELPEGLVRLQRGFDIDAEYTV